MEIRAIAKSVRIGPRKVRLAADMIRHLSIDNALAVLEATPKRGALPLVKILKSAVANAVNNAGVDRKILTIASLEVTDGQALKRFHPSTRGRTHPYKRRSSNIRVILKAAEALPAVKKTEDKKEKEIKKIEKKIDNKKGVKS